MGSGSALIKVALLILPIIGGLFVAVQKPAEFVAWINSASAWWDRHYSAVKAKGGFIVGGVWRALIWGFHKLHGWTEGVEDEALRAGIRLALFFYIGGLSLIIIASAIYVAVVLALIAVGLWILGMVLGGESDSSSGMSYTSPSASQRGRSRRRKDWLGEEYVEHSDDSGEVVGRSRVKKDWLGDTYVERRNADGDIEETTRARTDWLGDEYVEHRNADGERVGESRSRQDWLGDEYVEHRDADGVERSRSTQRRDWLGDQYTEHEPRE